MNSQINYCHDNKIFFNWIISENLCDGSAKDVPPRRLEQMTVMEAESFFNFLHYELNNKELTVNRTLSALKSLFNYLQNIAETPDLKPYINQNVMAKIKFNENKECMETRANKMEGKILLGDEYEKFRLFIAHDFGEINKGNTKVFNFYQLNKERDTAIISLILGSGLRLSELVNLDLDDIDFSQVAMSDLQDYLSVRVSK